MTVGAASSALVSQNQLEQEQVQQQVIPLPLERLMAVAETSVGVFEQIAIVSDRLEASERQNREIAVMHAALVEANAQAISVLSDQVKALGTLQTELAASREENAKLKATIAAMRESFRQFLDVLDKQINLQDRWNMGQAGSNWVQEATLYQQEAERIKKNFANQ